LGAAGLSLALIVANPMGSSAPSFTLPSISLPGGGSATTTTAAPVKAAPVKKQVIKDPKGYNLSLEAEVKATEVAAKKATKEEKAAIAKMKQAEAAAAKSAAADQAAAAAEKKVRVFGVKSLSFMCIRDHDLFGLSLDDDNDDDAIKGVVFVMSPLFPNICRHRVQAHFLNFPLSHNNLLSHLAFSLSHCSLLSIHIL
jgi:hypothetical protein